MTPNAISPDELPDSFVRDEQLARQLGMKTNEVVTLAEKVGISVEDIDLIKAIREDKDFYASVLEQVRTRAAKPRFPERRSPDPVQREERVSNDLTDAPEKTYSKASRSVRSSTPTGDPKVWLREMYKNDDGIFVCQICKNEMPFKKRDDEYYFESVESLSRDYFRSEHEAQFLALCPVCAAKYKEFVKNDPDALRRLRDDLLASDQPEIRIGLGKEEATIRFVDVHFADLRTILTIL